MFNSLPTYILRRLGEILPLLFGLLTVVFFLARLMPGDATDALISPTIPASVREQLREQFGLDRPLVDQYVSWIRSALRGDLGVSFTRAEPVTTVIAGVLPNTLVLGGAALLIEVVLGVLLALPVLWLHGTRREQLLSRLLLGVYAIPSFWIGMILLMVFSYWLGWFPSSQMYSSDQYGSFSNLIAHLVLPALTIAIPAAAALARYMRSSLQNVQRQEFVLFARSLGLPRTKIVRSYILPNAASPLIALAGVEFGVLMTGVLVTETLYSWPGMGQLTVHAIFARDYPLIMGCVLVAGVVVAIGNLAADVANAILDPRLRFTR